MKISQHEAQAYIEAHQLQHKLSRAINTTVAERAKNGAARIAGLLGDGESDSLLMRITRLEEENRWLRELLGTALTPCNVSIQPQSADARADAPPKVLQLKLLVRGPSARASERRASFAAELTQNAVPTRKQSRRPSIEVALDDGTLSQLRSPRY
eukprot:5740017-Prymnesium_polylepis.1